MVTEKDDFMYTEDIIEAVIGKFKDAGKISFPKRKNDFIDLRSEDSSQDVPPHVCYRFTTPEIDAINATYPEEQKKPLGKFRFRFLCLFELYTYNTHDTVPHEGFTLDLTFPVPEEDDELTPIRTKAFDKVGKVFTERSWARPYSGALWHHFKILENSERALREDPRGYEVALTEYLNNAIELAISLSKKID